MKYYRAIRSMTELICGPISQSLVSSKTLRRLTRSLWKLFRSLFKRGNTYNLLNDSISGEQEENPQTRASEKKNEETVQEMKTLLDKFVCLSDNKPTYTSAGDHLKAAQDQNAVLQEKLLQLKLMIQQEEAPLMMTLGISTDEYQDQIQALEQQKEVLQKELEELKRKRSEEAARRIDLKYLDAQKCELEGQCQHIQEVIQIHSPQYEVVYPEEIQEMKSLILFLKDEVEILLEEQKEVENSRPGSKGLEKEYHQLMKDVEDLKKNNSDQKGELEELNLDLLERQQIPAKLEAIKKEQESLRKENSVLTEQISECRSKIQQTTVLNKPQRPAGNRHSLIPVLAKRLGQKKQVSTDAGATQQPKAEVNKPQRPAGNPPSPKPDSCERWLPVHMDLKPNSEPGNLTALKPQHSSSANPAARRPMTSLSEE
ncbi:hypothetical protein FQA47_002269 [Oryzias melastigma]|uniref:Uncharacterized protein n=1 Tax=Oryzias melastigma TaxID=30732 RepID=A0A834C3I3_ORYME|nr:hypothetical protein FQA47_002269 [Oryzias melastigma]